MATTRRLSSAGLLPQEEETVNPGPTYPLYPTTFLPEIRKKEVEWDEYDQEFVGFPRMWRYMSDDKRLRGSCTLGKSFFMPEPSSFKLWMSY